MLGLKFRLCVEMAEKYERLMGGFTNFPVEERGYLRYHSSFVATTTQCTPRKNGRSEGIRGLLQPNFAAEIAMIRALYSSSAIGMQA